MQGFALEDIAEVFQSLQAVGWDAVLVGGQAVNVWACHYERDLETWRALRPYTSRDLDYHGGPAEARLAMRTLHAQGRLNTGSDPGPNAGVLRVTLKDGRELLIDVLTGLYGLSAAEMERTAVTWIGTGALAGLTFRVIHPLLLLEGKTASLRGLPQVDRQDAKHLRILTMAVREWLREQLAEPRAVFRAVERLAACAAGPDGLHAFSVGIDLVDAIPLEEMQSADGFTLFFERRLPEIEDKIADKRARHLEAIREQDA